MNTAFQGTHIKVLFTSIAARLRDKYLLSCILTKVVTDIGMTPLSEPVIHNVGEKLLKLGVRTDYIDTGGITGFIPLSTSHCAIHTWPLENEAVLDVYSCKKFDILIPQEIICDFYMPDMIKVSDLSGSLYLDGSRNMNVTYRIQNERQ